MEETMETEQGKGTYVDQKSLSNITGNSPTDSSKMDDSGSAETAQRKETVTDVDQSALSTDTGIHLDQSTTSNDTADSSASSKSEKRKSSVGEEEHIASKRQKNAADETLPNATNKEQENKDSVSSDMQESGDSRNSNAQKLDETKSADVTRSGDTESDVTKTSVPTLEFIGKKQKSAKKSLKKAKVIASLIVEGK